MVRGRVGICNFWFSVFALSRLWLVDLGIGFVTDD